MKLRWVSRPTESSLVPNRTVPPRLGLRLRSAPATPGNPARAAPASAVVAVRNLRLVLSGPFLFASSVMTSPPRSDCLGRSWLYCWNAYSIGCLLTGSRLNASVAHGTNLLVRGAKQRAAIPGEGQRAGARHQAKRHAILRFRRGLSTP